jgi:hypothetical protein
MKFKQINGQNHMENNAKGINKIPNITEKINSLTCLILSINNLPFQIIIIYTHINIYIFLIGHPQCAFFVFCLNAGRRR